MTDDLSALPEKPRRWTAKLMPTPLSMTGLDNSLRQEIAERTRLDYEYRLSWECPSLACVMTHQDVLWENLTDDQWNGLPWEWSYRIADGGSDIHSQRHTFEQWADDHYQPVRNVRFERRLRPNPDEGWDEVAVRGGTGVTAWKRAGHATGGEPG